MSDTALETRIPVVREGDVVLARQTGRQLALRLGFSESDPMFVATAISELARNMIVHAGTGEITATGQVQPIGGIQQKMVGARSAGATIFLTPAGNCSDTTGAVPAGLRLVKVSTLSQAMSDLEAIKAGKSVPSC